MTREFHVIVSTLPGFLEPSPAIAACRAGEWGILNLEYVEDDESALQAAATLAHYARGKYGLTLSCHQEALLSRLLGESPARPDMILLTGHDTHLLRQAIEAIHQKGLRVLLEVTDLEHARLGEELGVEGIVAKGYEAGGLVGRETAFVLLQHLLNHISLPIYVQGGIGLHTAAACYVAGAAGVLLDAQLALTRESRLPDAVRERIAAMDGSETICLGNDLGEAYRVYFKPGLKAVDELRRIEEELIDADLPAAEKVAAWRSAVEGRIGWAAPGRHVWPLGQDAAFAASLARRFVTVSGVLSAIRETIEAHCEAAARLRPLDEGSPLAQSHGTRYPIVQGPMTRVSDNAPFALEVARAGGLPFLALALMNGEDALLLLEETRRTLGQYPWGVGILGFVPPQVRQEQFEAIRATRPAFALIAGGRPDQARELEQEGIPTYLHVPSPELLRMFLADGATRFVFEGRECGGHVGPRSSFVLWEMLVDVLLAHLSSTNVDAQKFHVLFAGGIHDALSSSMVAALAAPLAERGVRVGVLMGTAYLFTREVVSTGAITPRYQQEALRGTTTVELETGLGHVTRCLPTPYVQTFIERKRSLLRENIPGDRLRQELEALNLGRLRIAAKGIARHPSDPGDPKTPRYVSLDEDEQYRQGMYMIGQVAALRDRVCTIEELHRDVSVKGTERLTALVARQYAERSLEAAEPASPRPSRIAIIGMACILPGATNLQAYWENILNKVDAITEIPPDRFDWRRYFDPDRHARDKIYSRWGGFIDEIPFNPLDYGMPPSSIPSIEPAQLLMLEVVRAALADAGYLERPFPRERTGVIVAAGGGLGDLGFLYCFRSFLPHFLDSSREVIERLKEMLPEWTEDSFPGILLNVLAGRIANRFDLGGPNYVVDAACGSSLAAVDAAVKDLETHRVDMAIVGAADTVQSPFAFLAFSKTQALSPSGRSRPFDANADGIAISEGIAVVILKRLEDAERDGDRIYAVIQGIGASSDGRDRGLTAPRPAGQLRALRRAYTKAGISPATVGLVEAHGTGTRVGDVVEVEALNALFQEAQSFPRSCAIGSVKSMIGHTKSTAGLAGLIKTALALYHKILPPTLVDEVNPDLCHEGSPFYVNTAPRPWLVAGDEVPRRAGVSAFGFGGTNFHAVLEEYRDAYGSELACLQTWPAELFILSASDQEALQAEVDRLIAWLAEGNEPPLRDLAYTLYTRYRQMSDAEGDEGEWWTAAVVATSLADLQEKLAQLQERMRAGEAQVWDARGIYFSREPLGRGGKRAFLFPGQGSQYLNMLRDLVMQFPRTREAFEEANRALAGQFPKPLSDYIFPPPACRRDELEAQQQALTDTRVAQPALGAADLAVADLLREMGVCPDFVAGHSYGEIVALCWAGVFDRYDLFAISEARGRFMAEATGLDSGAMAAVWAGRDEVATAMGGIEGVTLANMNSPRQTVISGATSAVEEAMRRLEALGIRARRLPVACAFHSPLVEPARDRLARFLRSVTFHAPRIAVFSNTLGDLYPNEPEHIREILSQHLARPVEFQQEIEAMYEMGARVFIEAGPRDILSGLVRQILEGRPHLAVAIDTRGPGLLSLQKALGQLIAAGIDVRLDPLFEGRRVARLDLARPYESPERARYGPTTWLVNGGRARPWRDGEGGESRPAVQPLQVRLVGEAPSSSDQPAARREATETSPAQGDVPAEGPIPVNPASSTSAPSEVAPADGGQTASVDDEVAGVMLQYQQLMGRFLEMQQNIMLTYLGDASAEGAGSAPPIPDISERPPELASEGPSPKPSSAPEKQVKAASEPEESKGTGAPTASALDEPSLAEMLLTLVSERTGYPKEMLDLDANLEADLGIDSIKRVEILGALRQRHSALEERITGPVMERLQAQQTLRGIIEAVMAEALSASKGATAQSQRAPGNDHSLENSERPITASAEGAAPISRYILRPVEVPPAEAEAALAPDRVILITDDGRGIAGEVAGLLRQRGHRAVLIANTPGAAREAGDQYMADLTSPERVQALLAEIRQAHGPIGGLLHLAPLKGARAFDDLDLASWRAALQGDLVSLFLLIQGLHDDLVAAAQAGGACLLAATGMGGTFASGGHDRGIGFFPGDGGIAGLMKTAAHELLAVRVKVIDFKPGDDHAAVAQAVLHELFAGDGLVEVGYDGALRRILQPVLAPVDDATPSLELDPQSVVLITGGARGITAMVARELAARYQPTLILVGRSPLPPAEESPTTAGLTTAREIKAALIKSLGGDGRKVPLAEVEAAYARLLREREIRANLEALREAGSHVEYHPVDVRDEEAFSRLIDDIYRRFGRLDGVIHGAGLIEDKLIKDKPVASFRRVLSTKVDAAFTLSRKLRPETLKFLAFFSSVSGRFGNRGQGDYAAANEILNKLAVYLDQRWPARVMAINWGPWEGPGMVSEALRREFARRGVDLIPPEVGVRRFIEELRYGRKGEAEVLVCGEGTLAMIKTSVREASGA
ncbi:MAG TPA: SDR family NAD(P)-dependent oxidoreductase [Caldilineae bacterium]|nr:SDR family NAD(P)-dependent oxidoreductase [Caldilineae bacterium]